MLLAITSNSPELVNVERSSPARAPISCESLSSIPLVKHTKLRDTPTATIAARWAIQPRHEPQQPAVVAYHEVVIAVTGVKTLRLGHNGTATADGFRIDPGI